MVITDLLPGSPWTLLLVILAFHQKTIFLPKEYFPSFLQRCNNFPHRIFLVLIWIFLQILSGHLLVPQLSGGGLIGRSFSLCVLLIVLYNATFHRVWYSQNILWSLNWVVWDWLEVVFLIVYVLLIILYNATFHRVWYSLPKSTQES